MEKCHIIFVYLDELSFCWVNFLKVLSSETDVEFTLYKYRCENEIEKIKVEGKQNTYDIRIIGAKIPDNVNKQIKTIFSVILNL